MNAQKPDAEEIESFVEGLAESLSLDPLRAWWPDYLFHTTELRNAVAILDSGELLSREDAGDDMAWDNANAEIIGHTPDWVKQMVRFYFRPRTPTTYSIEGFRTSPHRDPHAYCPLPVMFILPALPILTAEGTQFADGNCSSREMHHDDDAAFFQALPFADIYHDGPWQSEEAERIRHRRQAEVLTQSPFDIREHQPHVRVRSVAERETLLSSLRPATGERYRKIVQVSSKAPLFFKHWTYIESVQALGDSLIVRFNESTKDRNEFAIRLSFFSLDGTLLNVRHRHRQTIEPLKLSTEELIPTGEPYQLQIELEGHLAYSGMLDPRQNVLFDHIR